MDTSWLQDFLTLAECGNFSRAAELRNVTQPAFSRRIRLLEDWAGAALVDRRTHNATLTPAGELFRPAANEILRRLNLARQETSHVATVIQTMAREGRGLAWSPLSLSSRGGRDETYRQALVSSDARSEREP